LVIQVLNSKLGITIRVSVTSATILTANKVSELSHCIISYLLKGLVRQLRTMGTQKFKKIQVLNYVSIN